MSTIKLKYYSKYDNKCVIIFQMSDNRLKKIFSKTVYKLAQDTKIPQSTLYRYNYRIPKTINIKLMKILAKHANLTVSDFMKEYLS